MGICNRRLFLPPFPLQSKLNFIKTFFPAADSKTNQHGIIWVRKCRRKRGPYGDSRQLTQLGQRQGLEQPFLLPPSQRWGLTRGWNEPRIPRCALLLFHYWELRFTNWENEKLFLPKIINTAHTRTIMERHQPEMNCDKQKEKNGEKRPPPPPSRPPAKE